MSLEGGMEAWMGGWDGWEVGWNLNLLIALSIIGWERGNTVERFDWSKSQSDVFAGPGTNARSAFVGYVVRV